MSRREQVLPDSPLQAEACPIVQVIDRVAGKWSVSILIAATKAPVRYTELERNITGISRRMLTLTLRNLERDGLLTRTVYPTVPPKVEYSATDSARELYDHLVGLVEWAERHQTDIIQCRNEYDREHQAAAAA
ncbi:winged helix-turn-helix transcriptional regulator [Stackebrandtia nassauensis]|uniref:Transcriptional regulator, HxlR family n=1 Tax=Stackebrandtia nassauensis (strain DSM 44728 / CIP 108903 / NRRL B-16338 / NBRC 102104 / LLR-40K-21) TaxID=446470 RepID=D3Q773_STANL|nr:helix-turn-helix domain-containing protein [Stackebrandtia nassauensis]ADD42344.1 transcriptional regulator, HxlR family [Stackebrandtia nassauensis DSM 44728]